MLRAYIELEINCNAAENGCIAAENECTVEESKCSIENFWYIHKISKNMVKNAKIYWKNSNS